MSNKKLKEYYKELREVNSLIELEASEDLIQRKRDILLKIKYEIRYNR